MGLDRTWIKYLMSILPSAFHETIESRGFDLVAIDATLDLHRVAELRPDRPREFTPTIMSGIESAALTSLRFLNGGNPDYRGPAENAYYWAKKSLVVCVDNPAFVPRAKNTTQENRGDGAANDGIMEADEFERLFSTALQGGGDLSKIYQRAIEIFSTAPTVKTDTFWRSNGFRWIIHNEFCRKLKAAALGPNQILVIDPYVNIHPAEMERLYRMIRLDLDVNDTYAKLGAFGYFAMTHHAKVQLTGATTRPESLNVSNVGEGEQKIISYLERSDTAHSSYLFVCNDNDVIYSLLMMMPSLVNPATGMIEKEIWVDLSQQNMYTMVPAKQSPMRFVNIVELWTKLMTYYRQYFPSVENPIEMFAFLACCTGHDFNDPLEPSMHGMKTSQKLLWNTMSRMLATEDKGYLDASGKSITKVVASESRSALSRLVTTTRCQHSRFDCEHDITIDRIAFATFYVVCCSTSLEPLHYAVQKHICAFRKQPVPKRDTNTFITTIRNLPYLIDVVDQLKADARALDGLIEKNEHNFSGKVIQAAKNSVAKIQNIRISEERCHVKLNSLQWTLNYMHRAHVGMSVSLDSPINLERTKLRESAAIELPKVDDNYATLSRTSFYWPWALDAVDSPRSRDYNNSYYQVETVQDHSKAFNTELRFQRVRRNAVLL